MGRGWILFRESAAAASRRRAGGLPRREALRAGALAAAGVAGTALLGGLGAAAGAARATRAAAGKIVLSVLPSQSWPSAIGPQLWELLHATMRPFLERNPGIEVVLFTNQGYQGATQAAMLAGAGPDVFSDWIMPPFVQNDLMLDMGPFIRRDNMDLGIFPPGEMSFFEEAALFSPSNPHGLYAVPAYLHTEAYAVRLDILDQLGLKYPEPGWTVREWTALWEAVTVKPVGGKKARYGLDIQNGGYDYSYNMITPYIFWGYGGEYVDPQDPTKCFLTSPGSLQCGREQYRLRWEGVAGSGDFVAGTVVCTHSTCTCGAQVNEAEQWRGFKWDYFEDPVWPVRRSSYAASDFYGIWSGTRHPEQAWALLKWMAFEPNWQRTVMRTALAGPNQARLWEEWTSIVRQYAPPLRDKNLEAFSKPVLRGEPYFGHVFRYAEAEVKTIIAKYAQLLGAQKITVDEAFAQMTRQIDEAQKIGAQTAAAQRRSAQQFGQYVREAKQSRAPIKYPQPPRLGPGQPPKNAPSLVQVSKTGVVTLVGQGGGMYTGSDSMTYAAGAFTESRGTFVARLVSIAAAKGTGLQDGARIGLAARSDLSDTAGEVALNLSMGRGLHMMVRPFPGGQGGDQKPATRSGNIGQTPVLVSDSSKVANYLLRPVWLKLVLDVDQWSSFWSLDGQTWNVAFAPVGMGFAGCWVGLFATGHGGNPVKAVFDHVSGFHADTFVLVGG